MKRFYYMLLLAVISMTIVSCDDWQWYDTPHFTNDVVGSWESCFEYDGYKEYDIRGFDVVRYDFYYDFMGRYTFYSAEGLTYIDFLWRTDGSRLKIWYDDGFCDDMYYGFDDGCLIVSSSRHFTQYIGYRPAGFYYEQEKSIDPAKAKSFNPTTDERPRSATATIKAKE